MEMDDHQANIINSLMRSSAQPSAAIQALANAGKTNMVEVEKSTMEAARNPQTSRDELLTLGSSSSAHVRALVAARADCPLQVMISLANDGSTDVRKAVASNPAVAPVAGQLAHDKHVDVVSALLTNPAVPHDVLVSLASHKKRGIRNSAAERLIDRERQARARSESAAPELRDRVFGGPSASESSAPQWGFGGTS
jgi:hypothetical protein